MNYEFLARSAAENAIRASNVIIKLSGYDKDLIEEVAKTKGRVGPEVRCCEEPDSPEEAKLISLRDGTGELVGFSCVKLCDTGHRALDEYLWDTYRHQYARGCDPFDRDDLPDLVRAVKGRVAYIGDFWLRSDRRIDMTALAILSLSIAHRDFSADWNYFFTRHRNYWRGLGARYLATSNIPFAINWKVDVDHRRHDDCLYITRRDEAYRTERKYVQNFPPVSAAQPSAIS